MKKDTKSFWKSVVAYIGPLLAVLGFIYMLFNHEADHLRQMIPLQVKNAVTEALTPIQNDMGAFGSQLAEIKGQLEILKPQIQEMLLSKFKKISSQPKLEFNKQLPELRQTVTSARLLGVQPDATLLKSISLKLSQVNNKNGSYWPTTAEFLTFRSEAYSPVLAEKVRMHRDTLPRCTESSPSPPVVNKVLDLHTVEIKMAVYEKCRVQLDNPEDEIRLNKFIHEGGVGIEFRESLIEYHGGEIHLILFKDKNDPNRQISSFAFTNCIFDFSTFQEPSPDAQRILLSLLLNHSGELFLYPGANIQVGKPPNWDKP